MWNSRANKLHTLNSKLMVKSKAFRSKSLSLNTPYFVGICGGSGSGKSTFCRQMVHLLGEERVLHLKQENYYKDLTHLSSEEKTKINFDHPDFIEFPLLVTHLDELFFGKTILLPQYDSKKYLRINNSDIILPKPIVLVEGVLLLSDDNTQKRLNHKIFIDTPEDIRLERRLKKDLKEHNKTKEWSADQFNTIIKPMHNLYVEPGRSKADQIVCGQKPFDQEIKELCLKILNETLL